MEEYNISPLQMTADNVKERVISKHSHFMIEDPPATIVYSLEKYINHKVTLLLFLQDKEFDNPKWDLLKSLSLVCGLTKVPLASDKYVRFNAEIWVSVETFQKLKIQLGGDQNPSPFTDYLLVNKETPIIILPHQNYGEITIVPKFPSNLGQP